MFTTHYALIEYTSVNTNKLQSSTTVCINFSNKLLAKNQVLEDYTKHKKIFNYLENNVTSKANSTIFRHVYK